jgi:hypothetical protein
MRPFSSSEQHKNVRLANRAFGKLIRRSVLAGSPGRMHCRACNMLSTSKKSTNSDHMPTSNS